MINLIKTIKKLKACDAVGASPLYWISLYDGGKFEVTDVQISGDTLMVNAEWWAPIEMEYVNLDFVVNEENIRVGKCLK